jgi:hypothetical protein
MPILDFRAAGRSHPRISSRCRTASWTSRCSRNAGRPSRTQSSIGRIALGDVFELAPLAFGAHSAMASRRIRSESRPSPATSFTSTAQPRAGLQIKDQCAQIDGGAVGRMSTTDTPVIDTAAATRTQAAPGVRSRLRPEKRPENPSWQKHKGRRHAARPEGSMSGKGHSRTCRMCAPARCRGPRARPCRAGRPP